MLFYKTCDPAWLLAIASKKEKKTAVHGKGGLEGTNENVLVGLFSLNIDMPLTSTKPQPPNADH